MSHGSSTSSNYLGRFFKAPIRLLGRVRDSYVDAMMGCSKHVHRDVVGGFPGTMTRSRSYDLGRSRNATIEGDIRMLARIVSPGNLGPLQAGVAAAGVPRSPNAMAVARINEDQVCTFEDDVKAGQGAFCNRSRSCAVGVVSRRRVELLA